MTKRTHAVWIIILILAVISASLTGYQRGVSDTEKPIRVYITSIAKNAAPDPPQPLRPESECTGDRNDSNWLYPVSANKWKYFEGGMLPYRVTCG